MNRVGGGGGHLKSKSPDYSPPRLGARFFTVWSANLYLRQLTETDRMLSVLRMRYDVFVWAACNEAQNVITTAPKSASRTGGSMNFLARSCFLGTDRCV